MKYFKLIVLCFALSVNTYSQSDNCSSAPALTVNPGCSSPVSGSSSGATQSIPGCVGNADDDVWYKFVATASSVSLQVTPSASYDAVVEVFSGSCGSLVSLNCTDAGLMGGQENVLVGGLTIGNTYYIRIYHYYTGSGSSTFTVCLTQTPGAPANDACSGATNLAVNSSCSSTAGSSYGATQSQAGCVGTADDDVWYSFTANNYTQTIQVTPSAGMDAVVQLFSGSCGALTSISCTDNALSGGAETINAVGLTPGVVYYIRVYDYYSGSGYPFSICVTGNSIGATQPNDNPCSAIQLPAVTSDCNYLQFSTVGATATSNSLAPTPASCAGGSPPAIGGYTTNTKDVWFKITVPASGNVFITPQPNLGAGYISDGVMAIYSGACNALTQIACSDDYSAYPGTSNDLLPYLAVTGQTPGTTLYLRYWAFGTGSGTFGICVQSPTNDNCSSSLFICDLNGYSGSTSAAYSVDRPCNMRGNAEMAVTYSYTPGTNQNGIFGQGGPWGVGAPAYDVQINNNSWIKFTAASTSASFKINIGNCWVGNYPSGGIQMQIFSAASACCNFTPVSDFKEGSSTFTINANGLTVGNDYYLMIDGYANDICNYSINALTGVSFPNITAAPDSICPGGTSVLYGPSGASSYTWLPGGANTSSINVAPGTTITYTCIAGGVCGFKQTLTKKIVVKPLPTVAINSGNPISNCGTQTTLLSASGATSYSWSTGSSSVNISVSPSVTTSYTLTGITNGCSNTVATTVTVNPVPTTSISAGSLTICSGNSTTLTASGATSYTWNTGANTSSINVTPAGTSTYNVTGSNSFGCTKTATVNITVNALPTINTTSATVCSGNTATVMASGGNTYSWSNGQSGASNIISPTVTTNYTVTGTGANSCTNSAIAQVSVNSLPLVTVNSPTICSNKSATLSSSGANIYNWSTSSSGPSIIVSPTTTTSYTVTGTDVNGCVNTAISSVTVFNIPQITSPPSVSSSNCGASTGSITSVTISGTPSLTYTWTNGTSSVVGNSPNLLNQPAGTYNLQVTDGKGCINTFGPYSIVNPGAPSAPTVSATVNSLCAGGTIQLFSSSSSPGATFNWSGPNSFNSTQQNPNIPGATSIMSGVYAVYATASGCSGPANNVTITVNDNPVPNATSSSNPYCSGNTIYLFSSSATTYTWSGPSGFSSSVQNPTITNAGIVNTGTYQLNVTDGNGCSGTTTLAITVNSNPSLSVTATSSAVCQGSPVFMNALGGDTYAWSGPNGFNATTASASIAVSSTLNSGTYSVTTTNSVTGCLSSGTLAVLVNSLPVFTASANSSSVCTNSNIVLNASGTNIISYTWSGPSSYTASGTSQTISPASNINTGNYSLTVIDNNGCQNNQVVSVFVYSLSPVTASTGASGNTFCTGNNINLTGSAASSYTWSGPAGFTSNIQNPVISNAGINSAGIYTLNISDANGCVNSATTSVTINLTPVLTSVSNGSTCSGQNIILFAGFGSGSSVNWYTDLSLTSPVAANSNTYSPAFGANGIYTFYAQGTLNGCTSTVVPVTATYYNINAAFTPTPVSGLAPLVVQFTNQSNGVNTNQAYWTFSDGNTSTLFDPANTFETPGTYTVTLLVSNGLCSDTAVITIKVDNPKVSIPEVFTPNGDGHNEVFDIENIDYFPGNELEVYNRWGNLVYRAKDYKNDWNGSPNVSGKTGSGKLPSGTYFYLLKLNDADNQVFKGFVVILY